MLGAFAEFERELIRERQREGIAIAKAKGVYKGRKRALTPDQVKESSSRLTPVSLKRTSREPIVLAERRCTSTCVGPHRRRYTGQNWCLDERRYQSLSGLRRNHQGRRHQVPLLQHRSGGFHRVTRGRGGKDAVY